MVREKDRRLSFHCQSGSDVESGELVLGVNSRQISFLFYVLRELASRQLTSRIFGR